jgi:RNA polymerase sigma-70 factor (ECF subfamily)
MIGESPGYAMSQKPSGDEEELRQLMVRYQQADPAAVEELVARLSPALYRFLAGPDLARHDVEDLLQECWIRIHRSRRTYRSSEPLLPWIFAIARHSRLDGYRRRTRLRSRESLVAEVPETEPAPVAPSAASSSAAADIVELVNALPRQQREVIMMLKVSGMSLSEVARATASTTGAVKQKAHRAYKKLRQLFAEKRHDG